ncbi:DUF2829 domain-containing protein [Oceanidesulfovibrio marinus]|uniref:Thoeris anti-defense 2-like domain-containing protein n=1 Tax=Oceanidesulfovibrio marinus TaxID=370038 RepID=A0A6P1ZBC5_9BACT|nr:DUF2829 domain-containing protein [Oceanidesulfovibrio marinus]TVM31215.1 hypothetical protein DQK91_19080 [Oceanidesulfovibrio marinus]
METEPTLVNFEYALGALKEGCRMRRRGWNGLGQYVQMQQPTERSKMTAPYCYLHNTQGGLVPWVPSQGDLFADDWELA